MQQYQYRLVRSLGSGGMAQVAEAIATTPSGVQRRVALKQVLPEFISDQHIRRMFLHEAQLASQLRHSNIVQVLDYGIVADREMIVMELVDGVDAARAIGLAGAMPEPLALHIAAETAYALEYVHQRRDDSGTEMLIVHRDISPHNIMLSWDGDVKLTDFGIALSTNRALADRTRTGLVKGKACYLAPEQQRGERASAAADIYALGVSLHCLLCEKAPTCSHDKPCASAACDARSLVVSNSTRALVERCLSAEPTTRPTAVEVARTAGTLALRSLERDGRGALRDWLAPWKRETPDPGRLDDVMGGCLVPEGGSGRRFTRSTPGPPRPGSLVVARQRDPAGWGTPDDGAAAQYPLLAAKPPWQVWQRARMAARWVVVLSGLALGALVVAKFTATPQQSLESLHGKLREIAAAPVPSASLPAPAPADRSLPLRPGAPTDRPPAAPPHNLVQSHDEASTSREQHPRLKPAVARPIIKKRARSIAAKHKRRSPSAVAVGYLRIGGPLLLDGIVYIDDRRQTRRPPALFRLSLGRHRIEIYDSGGHHLLLERNLEITEDADRATPLALIER